MNHIPYEKWLLYVKDELPRGMKNEYEDHMYECDHCMALYMKAVEAWEDDFPAIRDGAAITNSIMDEIMQISTVISPAKEEGYSQQKDKIKTGAFHQKPIFHYVVAAAMTLLLMSSGIFQTISSYVNQFEQSAQQPNTSFTKHIMNKTVSIVDRVENESKEEK
ncbi:hypothetical protein [Falsibacillus albus]|uniref:Zf-HC2 domain-containing protein n=1 Tax=Falsibacillus albus TaxID=2478915 RepID=A0A3L7JZF8_9BACI|nr:hypothetical protein [Falsibacillus albus]RLQ93762.1 hypothetical protein D9X91_15925 [Falsibacillus albus]